MNTITNAFKNKKIFIPFLTAGYPTNEKFVEIVKMFDQIGAGIVEVGIPFSDPLADGKTIQYSSKYVLDRGINIDIILDLVRQIRQSCSVPIVFMTYYNIIFQRGIEKFVNDSKEAGVDGLIVPDLPPEEAEDLIKFAKGKLALTFLVTTVTTPNRVDKIINKTSGFIYFVPRLGVTGIETELASFKEMKKYIVGLKQKTKLPIAVGFGVSSKKGAKAVYDCADGVIVGSAIIKFIQENIDDSKLVDNLRNYCREFVAK